LIQRDYSGGGFYDYYTHGGSKRLDLKPGDIRPAGPEKKTDTGRPVYEGGGISPDEAVNPRTITPAQRRLLHPLFAFTRELVNGRAHGAAQYKVPGSIDFEHELQPEEFPITGPVLEAFKEFVANDSTFKNLSPILDRNRSFIELQLRFNLVTAAYGRIMGERVFITTDDQQVIKAIDSLPRARDLAMTATKQHAQP
jgi:carboxyl-terminal processing protease